MKKDSENS